MSFVFCLLSFGVSLSIARTLLPCASAESKDPCQVRGVVWSWILCWNVGLLYICICIYIYVYMYICIYIYTYIPGTPLTSIFEGQPLKARPFPTKTRVIWVPGMYPHYSHTYVFSLNSCFDFSVGMVARPQISYWIILPESYILRTPQRRSSQYTSEPEDVPLQKENHLPSAFGFPCWLLGVLWILMPKKRPSTASPVAPRALWTQPAAVLSRANSIPVG